MSWAKDPIAIECIRRSLVTVRAELRYVASQLDDDDNWDRLFVLLKKDARLSSALAYGSRGVQIKPFDYDGLMKVILCKEGSFVLSLRR